MIEAIEAFVLAGECNSFSKTAKKLNKSQSAISQLIHNLEIDLGYDVFDRNGKLIKLNANGEALLKQARLVKAQYQRFLHQAESLRTNQKHRLRIGVDPLLSPDSLPQILQDFESIFPQLEVNLVYRDSVALNQLMASNELDFMIGVAGHLPASEFHSEIVGETQTLWVTNEKNAFRINKAEELFELSSFRFLIPPQFQSEALRAITEISSVWWVDDRLALLSLGDSNANIACVPESVFKQAGRQYQLRLLNSAFLPRVKMNISLNWRFDDATRPFFDWFSHALANQSSQRSPLQQVIR